MAVIDTNSGPGHTNTNTATSNRHNHIRQMISSDNVAAGFHFRDLTASTWVVNMSCNFKECKRRAVNRNEVISEAKVCMVDGPSE